MPERLNHAIPLLVRRGGRDIKKNGAKATFLGADGVVAYTPSFQNAFRNITL